MTPQERKSRTTELFHAALAQAPNQQSAFLEGACAGDAELLRKVKALLGAYAEIRTSGEIGSKQPSEFTPDPDALLALSERYEAIEVIGHGGMGVVFRARDHEIDKLVALKMIHPALAQNGRAIERFRNEIRVALEITHKNVCRTYGLERFPGMMLIVMEYVEGETLRTILDRAKGVSVSQGLLWSQEICDALTAAHEKGIVHRDLKPENIMIDRQGHVKVMDFGIARSIQSDQITAGTIVGTPRYMSPEQAAGGAIGQTSDIYSLGLLLYELFTGNRDGAATRGANPGLPRHIDRAIRKCLERDPRDRFQSAATLAAALARSAPNRLAKLLVAAGLVSLALLAVMLTLWLSFRREMKPVLPVAAPVAQTRAATPVPASPAPAKTTSSPPKKPVPDAPVRKPKAKTAESQVAASALPPPTTMDGTWNATIADAKGSAVVQFNLFAESDGNVVGTYSSSLGGGGSMKGTIHGNILTFELAQTIQGCSGSFKGTGTVETSKGTGTYTGSDCQGDHGTGTFTMYKTGPRALTEHELLAEQEQMVKVRIAAYLQSKLYQWTVGDARQVMGEPLAHEYVYDDSHNMTNEIYAFKDPTLVMHHVALSFDSKTSFMREFSMYPFGMTWNDCQRQFGKDVTILPSANGMKTYSYKNMHLNVRLDNSDRV